jgi:transcriptional regulator with GAF, ATPase, and Fis domain
VRNHGWINREKTGLAREDLLARTFVELADVPVDAVDLTGISQVVAQRCVELFDVSAAAIVLADPDGPLRVASSSSAAMRTTQRFELQANEGPGVDCYRTATPVVDLDLTRIRPRWRRFSPVAVAAGFSSVHAVPIQVRGQVIGVLNLFRSDVGTLDGADTLAAQALAEAAAITILRQRALGDAQLVAGRHWSISPERAVIEQGKGILAGQARVSVEVAFERIRRYAHHHNLQPAEVCKEILGGTLSLLTIPESSRWRKGAANGP